MGAAREPAAEDNADERPSKSKRAEDDPQRTGGVPETESPRAKLLTDALGNPAAEHVAGQQADCRLGEEIGNHGQPQIRAFLTRGCQGSGPTALRHRAMA